MNEIKKFLTCWKGLVTFILMVIPILVWAADTRYVSHVGLKQNRIEQMRQEISILEVHRNYAETDTERKKYETIINIKNNQIKGLRGI